MRNCIENEFFFCKNEIGNNIFVLSVGNIKIIKNIELLLFIIEILRLMMIFLVIFLIIIFKGV